MAKYQGYSLAFWPKLAHFDHLSICIQNQSMSMSVICRSVWAKYQGYSLTLWPKLAHCHHLSICNQNQSISISGIVAHLWQNTKAIALLSGQNWLILITCQSAINSNQCQFRSCVVHVWAKYQGYNLTFWPKLAHCHHLSICNQQQSMSISVICRSFLDKIERL